MDKLKFINKEMDALSVPYEFGGVLHSKVAYPYGVGEIIEETPLNEDGAEESTLLLTFWHRGKGGLLELEKIKSKIKKHFHPIYGLRGETDSGTIAVFFDTAFPVPSGEAGIYKIQINLKIKEWKGDL